MRTSFLVAVSLVTVVLAGCTDDQPTGEFSSGGAAIPVTGAVVDLDTQQYATPASAAPAEQQCLNDDVNQTACTYPYTKLSVNFTALPDPDGGTYSLMFYNGATAAFEAIAPLDAVHLMGTSWMGSLEYDNEADCVGQQGVPGNELCDKTINYDSVRVMLDDVAVAQAALNGGAAFEVIPTLTSGSFSGSYNGKSFTVTTSLGDANLTYTAWLITSDDTGAMTHAEDFTVSAAGETVYAAELNGNKYAEIHIHVAGTKLNVGIATL